VRFSDDMTGIYVVNPDPDEPFATSVTSNELFFSGVAEDEKEKDEEEDDEEDDDDFDESDVFGERSAADYAEPEVEVVAVADAFAKFRRLDQMIDEEDRCIPKERKPVRKITPPRDEPMLLERLQGLHPSPVGVQSATSGEQIINAGDVVGTPTAEHVADVKPVAEGRALKPPEYPSEQPVNRVPSVLPPVSRCDDQRDSGRESVVGATAVSHPDASAKKPTDGAGSERPEPGTIRALRQRWEMKDTGGSDAAPSGVAVATSSSSSTRPLGEQVLAPAAEATQPPTLPAQSAAKETVVDGHFTATGGGSRTRQSLPTSLAFTRNRLAKFRLLESKQLERQTITVRHKVKTIGLMTFVIAFSQTSLPFSALVD
jgi:hypothetical protein